MNKTAIKFIIINNDTKEQMGTYTLAHTEGMQESLSSSGKDVTENYLEILQPLSKEDVLLQNFRLPLFDFKDYYSGERIIGSTHITE